MKLQDHEGQTLAYKQEWCEDAKKTLIAFANGLGGILQIGVAKDGEIIGCSFSQVERAIHRFARDGVDPPMEALIDVRKQMLDGKVFASVLVRPGIRRPYALRGKVLTQGGAFIRLGGQTVPAALEEILQLIHQGDPRAWESRPCGLTNLTFEQAAQIFHREKDSIRKKQLVRLRSFGPRGRINQSCASALGSESAPPGCQCLRPFRQHSKF